MTYIEFVPKTSRKKPITHLAIVAHKDDGEMVGMQGITSCFESGGFALIVLTDGGNCPRDGKYKGVSYEDMVELRTAEQKRAATYGKYEKVDTPKVADWYAPHPFHGNIGDHKEPPSSKVLDK